MMTFKDVTNYEHLVSPKQPKYRRGFHPNSRKNLLGPRWQKGQSGNPNGYSLTAALKDALRKPLKKSESGRSAADELIYSTIEGAINLEPAPFHEVWDRVEGKVPDKGPPAQPGNQTLNIIMLDGSKNLSTILEQVREKTKRLEMGDS